MRSCSAAVGKDVGVVAAGILQGVGQDGEGVQAGLGIHLERHPLDRVCGPGQPLWIDAGRPERVAEDLPQQFGLCSGGGETDLLPGLLRRGGARAAGRVSASAAAVWTCQMVSD